MYTRLLIPLDESKTAEAALPYGRTLARAFSATIGSNSRFHEIADWSDSNIDDTQKLEARRSI